MRAMSRTPTTKKMMLSAHIAQNGEMMFLFAERFAADETDVIDREHEEARADHEPHAAARKAQRERRADEHEHDARRGERELLLDLDAVPVLAMPRLVERMPWPR